MHDGYVKSKSSECSSALLVCSADHELQEDMSRAEELSAKFRTLSYDHERLMSMHRTANEKAANAEREMNMHKSRLAYVHPSIMN